MLEAPCPQDDEQRLAALQSLGLLDTPPEQRFNRITRTVARLFRVPIATITLVDRNRHWFKSRFGLFMAETPRNISFCGHAIMGEDMLVVEDALKDERFRDNPLVTGAPYIRFYAGRPLSTPSGAKLGTLCLIDREPRSFSEEDRLTLEDMAGWVEREINLNLELAAMQARLTGVLGLVVRGVVLLGSDGRVTWVNASTEQLTGNASGSLNGVRVQQIFADSTVHEIQQIIAASDGLQHAVARDIMIRHKDGKIVTLGATMITSTIDGQRFVTVLINRK